MSALDEIRYKENPTKLDKSIMGNFFMRVVSIEELEEAAAELLKLRKIVAVADKMAERFEGSYNKGDEEVLAEYNEAISE